MKLTSDSGKSINNLSSDDTRFDKKLIDLEFEKKKRCQNHSINFNSFHTYNSNEKIKNNYINIKTTLSCFNNYIFMINILFLSSFVIPSVNSLNQFGCVLDKNLCDFNEKCDLNDSFLGKCIDDQEQTKDSPRSETETYLDNKLDKAPIRIHKYSLDDNDYKDFNNDYYGNTINLKADFDNGQEKNEAEKLKENLNFIENSIYNDYMNSEVDYPEDFNIPNAKDFISELKRPTLETQYFPENMNFVEDYEEMSNPKNIRELLESIRKDKKQSVKNFEESVDEQTSIFDYNINDNDEYNYRVRKSDTSNDFDINRYHEKYELNLNDYNDYENEDINDEDITVRRRSTGDDIIFSPPVIYESEGVDQNGNIFHDKQITLTGTSNKNIILNNDYSNNDYFYSDQLLPKQAVQDMSLEGLLFSLFNDNNVESDQSNKLESIIKKGDEIVVDAKEKNDRSDEKYEYLIPVSEQHNPDALKEFLYPSIHNINKPIEIIHNSNELNDDMISTLITDLQNQNKISDILSSDYINLDEIKRSDQNSVDENLLKIKQEIEKEQENMNRVIVKEKIDEIPVESEMYSISQNSKEYPFLENKKIEEFDIADDSYIFIELDRVLNKTEATNLLHHLSQLTSISSDSFKLLSLNGNVLTFNLEDPTIKPTFIVDTIINEKNQYKIFKKNGLRIISCGLGRNKLEFEIEKQSLNSEKSRQTEKLTIILIVVSVSVACTLLFLICVTIIKRRNQLKNKLLETHLGKTLTKKKLFDDEENLVGRESNKSKEAKNQSNQCPPWYSYLANKIRKTVSSEQDVNNTSELCPNDNYSELCRERMQTKTPLNLTSCTTVSNSDDTNTPKLPTKASNNNSTPIRITSTGSNEDSTRSSASSWSEEPITSINMDITTGHVILSYMEEHMNDKNRLSKEWSDLCYYEPDINKMEIGLLPENIPKNRYSNIIPYDHTRVKLVENKESNDYINASYITDDDPKNPAYIATQGPLMNTANDFWQMVWEQRSVLIVDLCRPVENGSLKCYQYWPSNGFEVYHKYEVHLVSEHVWCEDYLVRNFFIKNLETNQTRTVTQFNYLTWSENELPLSTKSILEFRRKVNKSYKSKSCPIIVHCNDGVGRTGTYIMIDMVLNKVTKGAKEIDLAATLEFMRDQRQKMVKNKEQFEFSFLVITEELQNMLKALGQ